MAKMQIRAGNLVENTCQLWRKCKSGQTNQWKIPANYGESDERADRVRRKVCPLIAKVQIGQTEPGKMSATNQRNPNKSRHKSREEPAIYSPNANLGRQINGKYLPIIAKVMSGQTGQVEKPAHLYLKRKLGRRPGHQYQGDISQYSPPPKKNQ